MRHPKKFLHFIKAVGARLSNSQLLLARSSPLSSEGAVKSSAMETTPPRKMSPYDRHAENNSAVEQHPSSSLAAFALDFSSSAKRLARGQTKTRRRCSSITWRRVALGRVCEFFDALLATHMHGTRRRLCGPFSRSWFSRRPALWRKKPPRFGCINSKKRTTWFYSKVTRSHPRGAPSARRMRTLFY